MTRLIQASMARGEIGPELYGRVDVTAYPIAVRTALNIVIHAYGGGSNRAGLRYVGPCSVHTGVPPQLIEFKYNTQDTYMLEFGDYIMRVIRNDAHVLEAGVAITAITGADPGVATATGHGYSDGQDVYVDGVVGMTEVNQRWFTVANKTANTFELTSQQTGAGIDTSGYTAYVSGGNAYAVYEVTTPYAIADTLTLKHTQSANVMTLTHQSYPPYVLYRDDHDDWTLEKKVFAPSQPEPEGVSVSATGSGTATNYRVTAVNEDRLEESLSGLDSATATITGATQADPIVMTAVAHGFLDDEEVEINDIVGMAELNGKRFTVSNKAANTFELLGEDGTGYTAYSSGGEAARTFSKVSGAATPDNVITWTAATGALKYSVYREVNGLYGWVGDTEALTFADENLEADLSLAPPKARDPFIGAGNYPATVSYYEQRQVFGGTQNDPDTAQYSVTGSEDNMSQSSPRKADDSIVATLNSNEVNAIRAFAPGTDLVVFTSGSEWKVNSGEDNAFSAETLKQRPQSNWGISMIDPVQVGEKILYITENGTYVRSLGYEITIDGYKGNNMTVFAPHIFKHYTAVDAAFTRWPDPVMAVVRSDGCAPVMTFEPEQEVTAWAVWSTKGKFKRVASLRPSSDDVDHFHYFVVERTIGGASAYYIERIHSRRFRDVRDCFFVDSGLSLNNPLDIESISSADPAEVGITAHGLLDGDEVDISDVIWEADTDSHCNETQPDQINGRRYYVAGATTDAFKLVKNEGRIDITGATQANPVVLTSAGHGLSDGEVMGVFDVVGMTELNGNVYKVSNSATDTFELTDLADVDIDGTGYTAYSSGGVMYPGEDSSAMNAYVEGGAARKVYYTVGNLWHLEGRDVAVLADGNVVTGKTVSNGQIDLAEGASRAHVGLSYYSDIETLNPEIVFGGETSQGNKMRIPTVTVRMNQSRGLLVGPDSSNLSEYKQREFENYGEPTQLLTGDARMEIESDWDNGGRMLIRQIYPLPMTVTAIIPNISMGSTEENG